MGFISHKVNRDDLEVGDHIYTWRTGFIYSHHGIYVGEGRVVHFTSLVKKPRGKCNSSLVSSSSFPDCAFKIKSDQSGVIVSCLNCFLQNGSLYRYQYGVGRAAFMGKIRGGTCTTAESDDREAVIYRAVYLLDNGFGEYHLLKHNCEDFALYCKTGLVLSVAHPRGCSGQVYGVANPFVRYYKDIGVRRNAKKVKVEDLATFMGNRDTHVE